MKPLLLSALTTFKQLTIYGCVIHCTFQYIADFVVCSGPSMEPTIRSDDILLTEHVSPLNGRIDRGDIVIARCPTNPRQQICKRVVGLPGDRVRTGGKFLSHETIVPFGHVWLQGDNAGNSSDSRSYGPVPQGLIRSRAVCRVWPLKDMAVLRG